PTPGVVLLVEAVRFDFEGEDKKKLDRVRKFYGAVTEVVELKRYSAGEAREEAQRLARAAGVEIDPGALELLVEALGADAARIAIEIEKLRLYSGGNRAVTEDDVSALVPDARSATVFALVGALGRRDRGRALDLLDTLVRDGEYLPLALSFLATQFRLALVAREANLRGAGQIIGHFSRSGVPMWGSRAEQVVETMTKFSGPQLERGLARIFEADRDLRSARPDDRVVMERLILGLTA
ncbi:MAG: DNA polymerase III subunit delta, partial [Bryobacteraceae bacterium]